MPAYAVLNEATELAKSTGHGRAGAFATGVLRAIQRALLEFRPDGAARKAEPVPAEEETWPRTVPRAVEERWPGLPHRRIIPVPAGRVAIFDRDLWPDPVLDPPAYLSRALSHPGWLVRRWLARWGSRATIAALEAGNRHPELSIRANPLRCTVAGLAARLKQEGIDIDPGLPRLRHAGPIAALASFRDGWFSVQDEAAQAVAPLMQVRAGERIADLCAAPGGKSAQLAELGANVLAADSDPGKVHAMRASFVRTGAGVTLLTADAKHPPLRPVFDGVLVDAPCSNTGVLSRRVEARWRLRERDVGALGPIQRSILRAALGVVKPGGRVVYSTCSVEDEENARLVREVIREGNGLKLEEELTILPGAEHTCGGYAARIRLRG